MIASVSHLALRYLRVSKTISISSVLTLAISIGIVLTLTNLYANTEQSVALIQHQQELTAFANPALSAELAAEYEHAQEMLSPLRNFIVGLSLTTLIISGLLAISNFSILHQRNSLQYSLLRAVGATKTQLARIGIVQAAVITAAGSVLGLIAAIAAIPAQRWWYSQAFSMYSVYEQSQFQLHGVLIFITLLACTAASMILLSWPARRLAAAVPTELAQGGQSGQQSQQSLVAAVPARADSADSSYVTNSSSSGTGNSSRTKALRSVILTLVLAGLSFIVLSLLDNVIVEDHATVAGTVVITNNVFTVIVGAALFIAALLLLLPIVLPQILESLIPALRKIIGSNSYLAVKNIIPQIQKSSLMIILVAAVVMGAVFGSSYLETARLAKLTSLSEEFPTEFILTSTSDSGDYGSATDIVQLRSDLLASSGIDDVSIVKDNQRTGTGPYTFSMDRREDALLFEVIVADLPAMQRQGIIPPSPITASPGLDTAVVSWQLAAFYDVSIGDIIELSMYSDLHPYSHTDDSENNQSYSDYMSPVDILSYGRFQVVDILREFPGYGPFFWFAADSDSTFFKGQQALHPYRDYLGIEAIYVSTSNDEAALASMSQISRDYPQLVINRLSTALAAADQSFFQMWSIVIVVSASLLVSSVLGVFNTLRSHIRLKRKEYAVLRALSVTQHGIVGIILTQVMLYLVSGLVFGALLGILLTYLLIIMDPAAVHFNLIIMAASAIGLVLSALLVFSYQARRIADLNPATELEV